MIVNGKLDIIDVVIALKADAQVMIQEQEYPLHMFITL